MNQQATPPNRVPWPPLIYATAIALGIVLHVLSPLPWFGSPFSDILLAVGAVMIVGALGMDFAAMAAMRKARTTILPHRAASHLVTSGPFGFSRNPIYLGNTMLTIGAGLLFGIAWMLPLALLAAVATTRLAIVREERHLDAAFGKRWRDYAKRVRRWI